MTEAQEQAKDKAFELLGEHFEHFVIVLSVDYENEESKMAHVCYDGGFFAAKGLLHEAVESMRAPSKREATDE